MDYTSSPQRSLQLQHSDRLYPSVSTSNSTSASYSQSTARSSESSNSRLSGSHGGLSYQRLSTESKPRLSKEQQDVLERHFKEHPKPSTATKKGFSEALNVPLDKVNNWFQNRRAKVKQEAKKHQSSRMMYYARMHSQPQQHQQMQHPSMYQQPMMDFTPRHSMGPGMQIPMPAEFSEPLVNGIPFVAQRPDGSNIPQGTMMEPILDDSTAFEQFFGLDDNVQNYDGNFNHNAYMDFGRTFHHVDTFGGMAPIPEIETSAEDSTLDRNAHMNGMPMMNMDMLGDEQMQLQIQHYPQMMQGGSMPMRSVQRQPPQQPRNFSRGPDMRAPPESNAINHDLFMAPNVQQHPVRNMDPQHYMQNFQQQQQQQHQHQHQQQHQQQHQHQQHQQQRKYLEEEEQAKLQRSMQPNPILSLSVPGIPPTDFAPNMHNPVNMMMRDPSSLYPSPPDDQTVESLPNVKQENMKQEPYDQKTHMTDQMDHDPALKQPNSGMAARRARRPAALGTLSANNRSSSYNSNMPTSPKPNLQQAISPDHTIRRVRSSLGVLNGRITKGAGASQKSPLAQHFPGHSDSPRLAKQMSLQSLNAMAAHAGHTQVPITPLSPMHNMRTPSMARSASRPMHHPTIPEAGPEAPLDPAWANMTDTFDQMQMPFYTSQAGTPQTGSVNGGTFSPPRTPMEVTLSFQQPPQQMMQTPQGQMMAPSMGFSSSSQGGTPQSAQHPFFMQQQPPPQHPQIQQQHQQHRHQQQFQQQQQQQNFGPMPPFAPQVIPTWMNTGTPSQQWLASQPKPSTPGEDVMSMLAASRRPGNITPTDHTVAAIHAAPEIPSGHSRFMQQPQPHQHPQFVPQQHQQFPGMPQGFFPAMPPEMQMFMQSMPPGGPPANLATSIGEISPMQLVGSPTGMGMIGIHAHAHGQNGYGSKHASPDFQIQEYAPKHPTDSSKLPPKARTPSAPKQYSFHHHGPEYYSSPPRDAA